MFRKRAKVITPTQYWLLVVAGLCMALAVFVVQIISPPAPHKSSILSRVDSVWYDTRFQLWPPHRDSSVPIVIVDLDEATQQREGRWPWDRSKVANLVVALQSYGAALIGFDVVFSEPGTNPVNSLLSSNVLPPSLAKNIEVLIEDFDGDANLAEVLGDSTVLGYFLHADGGNSGSLPEPFLELDSSQLIKGIISLPDYTANLDILADKALANGFIVTVPDADGIVRRMPLVMRHGKGIYSSLSLEMARIALRAPWLRLDIDSVNEESIITGIRLGRTVRIPVDNTGSMLIPYKGGSNSYTTISATGVLRGDAPQELLSSLNGAIVLIGTSALGLSDLRTIPLQTSYPGVEVHANVIDTILYAAILNSSKDNHLSNTPYALTKLIPYKSQLRTPFYQQPDWAHGFNAILLLFSGLLLSVMLPGKSPLGMLTRSFLWLFIMITANILMWNWWHFSLPIALQLALILLLSIFNIVSGYFISSKQRKSIQDLFGEYVPAEHVAHMLENPRDVTFNGEQREMTVLFADIRNFTSMSERLSATELKSVLNRYLSAITEVIFKHNGTIDKYVGDLVMAFWNAPLPDQYHASNAVAAALEMQVRMKELRIEFEAEGLPQFHIGIGINTGNMNVGDMGSKYRRAYTVMGDAVNLASRLEGLTDFYKAPILVSDITSQSASDYWYMTIDMVRVKGRKNPLNIYQPLERKVEGVAAPNWLSMYEGAVNHYQNGQFDLALEQFKELIHRYGDNSVYTMYLKRLKEIHTLKPTQNWSAVYSHEAK